MSAYVVFTRESTSDAEQMAQYAEKAPLAREGRDLTPLAFYGKFEVLEGSDIEGAVILRFPDMAAAREWYNRTVQSIKMRYNIVLKGRITACLLLKVSKSQSNSL